MTNQLLGKRVAFMVSNFGVEQSELVSPWQAISNAGGHPQLLAPGDQPVQAVSGDMELASIFEPDYTIDVASPEDFDALVLPGGVANADKLRLIPEAIAFTAAFGVRGRPIAAICHGPWLLVEADMLQGKTVTSWPSLQTDIRNAGGNWVDTPVYTDRAGIGSTLVTSRQPKDLAAFNHAMLEVFAEA